MNTYSPHPSSNQLKELLQTGKNLFGAGICLDAEVCLSQVISIMQVTHSANNPQLADAYALHGAICREIVKSYHGDQLKAGYQKLWLESARAEIACRSLACESEALAKVKYLFGITLACSGDERGFVQIAEAMQILSRLAAVQETAAQKKAFKGDWLK